ncbi:serine/threonine-protein kinase [Agromyces soli]
MTSDLARTDSPTGEVLGGRYRLGPRIGRGGMASVFRAEDESLGRRVAVKVFGPESDGIDDPARWRSETALLASVEHRALVRLYDAATDASTGRRFLVMELVDGTDLGRVLRGGPLEPSEVAPLAADLGEALHVIHVRGIVHRDVKPANVLLAPSPVPGRTWNPKLADFGVARLVDDARLTSTGLIIGTPAYLSPEQVSGATPGPASDVYGLGLVLLEALTGRRAFPGPVAESAAARLARDPEVPAAIGPEWGALIRAMTARDPGSRPSAIEAATAATALDGRAAAPGGGGGARGRGAGGGRGGGAAGAPGAGGRGAPPPPPPSVARVPVARFTA